MGGKDLKMKNENLEIVQKRLRIMENDMWNQLKIKNPPKLNRN